MPKENIQSAFEYAKTELKSANNKAMIIVLCLIGLSGISALCIRFLINYIQNREDAAEFTSVYDAYFVVFIIWLALFIIFEILYYRFFLKNEEIFALLFMPDYLCKMINQEEIGNTLLISYLRISWAIKCVFASSAVFLWAHFRVFPDYTLIFDMFFLLNIIAIVIGEFGRKYYLKQAEHFGYLNAKEEDKDSLDYLLNKIIAAISGVCIFLIVMDCYRLFN